MKIDRKINLVLTVDRENDTVYVHAIPLREEIFDANFLVLSRAWAAMQAEGGMWLTRMGPRNAARVLKQVAIASEGWDGPSGLDLNYMSEIRRTANVIFPSDSGWQSMSLQEALDKKFLTKSDSGEVENALTFFTLGCANESPKRTDTMMSTVFGLFGAQLTSSSSTEFQTSLAISTTEENSGEKVKPLSTPV